jgi:hypothetical protein
MRQEHKDILKNVVIGLLIAIIGIEGWFYYKQHKLLNELTDMNAELLIGSSCYIHQIGLYYKEAEQLFGDFYNEMLEMNPKLKIPKNHERVQQSNELKNKSARLVKDVTNISLKFATKCPLMFEKFAVIVKFMSDK